MNSVLITKELDNRQNTANNMIAFWSSCIKAKPINVFKIKKTVYPFWESRKEQVETNIYHPVITDITNEQVTVEVENIYTGDSECYVLEKDLFDFSINIGDMVELIVEKTPGNFSIKAKKYIKTQYYKEKEDTVIKRILKNIDEEDDI